MSKIIVINGADFSENACDVAFTHKITNYDEFFGIKRTHYVGADGIWVSGNQNYHILIPFEGTEIKVDCTEHCSTFGTWSKNALGGKAIVAFFSEIPVNNPGQAADGMIGDRVEVPLGTQVITDVPAGTKYLYIYVGYNPTPRNFTSYLPKAIYWR